MILDEIAFHSLLGKGEKIVSVAHKHPFVVQGRLFSIIFFGFAMPAGGFLLFPPFKIFWLIWAAVGALIFVYEWLKWYLDAWIVTNFAVIDQEWNSYFDKSSTRIEYQSIAGVSTEIRGFWGTILGFGNIQIEHVSAQPILLQSVANPRKVERILTREQQEHLQRQNFSDQSKLKDLLTNLLRSAAD